MDRGMILITAGNAPLASLRGVAMGEYVGRRDAVTFTRTLAGAGRFRPPRTGRTGHAAAARCRG